MCLTLALFQLDVCRTFTQLFLLSLPQIFSYPSIRKLLASFSFPLWPQHKLCGCTDHIIMTCSTSVALSGGCTICFSHIFSEIFLFLDYHKNHTTQFWERKWKCTYWPSCHRFQPKLVVKWSYAVKLCQYSGSSWEQWAVQVQHPGVPTANCGTSARLVPQQHPISSTHSLPYWKVLHTLAVAQQLTGYLQGSNWRVNRI